MRGAVEVEEIVRREEHADLPRQQHEHGEPPHGDHQRRARRETVGPVDAVIVLRAEVEAVDRLRRRRDADEHRVRDLVDLQHHPVDREGDVAAVDGRGAVFAHEIVHDDLHGGGHHLRQQARQAEREDPPGTRGGGTEVFTPHLHGFHVRQIAQEQKRRDGLADDGRDARADDAHRKREDKQRVERDVEQCPREHAPHGVLRRAVRADDGRERRAQQLERDPDGDGAQIRDGLGIGRLRCAEEPDELRREQRGERREHNAAHKQERHGLADGGVRLRLLPPPECETDIGGAAVAEQERDGSDEDNEREGDVRRRHAGDADAAADENLVDDVIQEVHHQCQRRGNGIAQEKGGDRCGFQRIAALRIIRHGGNLLYIII